MNINLARQILFSCNKAKIKFNIIDKDNCLNYKKSDFDLNRHYMTSNKHKNGSFDIKYKYEKIFSIEVLK